jgi:hypothetical protein
MAVIGRQELEKRLAEYEQEERKAEAFLLQVRGAKQAVKNLLADLDTAKSKEPESQPESE